MIYSIILYAAGLLLLVVGIAIWGGKTELIHDYHRKNVTDHKNYGKAMGKSVFIMGISLCAGATIPILAEELLWLGTVVFLVGFIAMLIRIYFIQKKYNGGMFR